MQSYTFPGLMGAGVGWGWNQIKSNHNSGGNAFDLDASLDNSTNNNDNNDDSESNYIAGIWGWLSPKGIDGIFLLKTMVAFDPALHRLGRKR